MTLPRSVELRWQKEVIERWLHTPGIPPDAEVKLLEMLADVKKEIISANSGPRDLGERNRKAS